MNHDALVYMVVTLVVVPVAMAGLNALEEYTRPRWPRFAAFVKAIGPHVQEGREALRKDRDAKP